MRTPRHPAKPQGQADAGRQGVGAGVKSYSGLGVSHLEGINSHQSLKGHTAQRLGWERRADR